MGFRSALLPLGISGAEIPPAGGFKAPLHILGISGNAASNKVVSDDGSGQDVAVTQASLSIPETGTGADLQSIDTSLHKQVSDYGRSLDDIGWNSVWPDSAPFAWYFPTESWPHTDSIQADASASETITVDDNLVAYRPVDVLISDSGLGDELTTLVSVGYIQSDSAQGSDTVTSSASAAVGDDGTGTDLEQVSASVSVQDSVTVIETFATTKDEAHAVVDPATGFDEVITSASISFQSDVATHVDSIVISQVQLIDDSVSASELLSFGYALVETPSTQEDLSTSIESQVQESVQGLDIILQTLANASQPDTASATEGIAISRESNKTVIDNMASFDVVASSAYGPITEAITVSDLPIVYTTRPPLTDTGTGNEIVAVYDISVELAKIGFAFSSRTMSFEFSSRRMTFNLRGGNIREGSSDSGAPTAPRGLRIV